MSDIEITGAKWHARTRLGYIGWRTVQRQRQKLPWVASDPRQPLFGLVPLKRTALALLLLVACTGLVHVSRSRAEDTSNGPKLPAQVADLRDVLLTAARSGKVEELRSAFDVSGAVPDMDISPRSDPIKVLKDRSEDPEARDTLAAIVEILEMPPIALPLGNDIENNLVYVWPYLAERPLDKLTPPEQVDLYRLVSPAKAAEMQKKKHWLWWRINIAADGTWTAFKKDR